MKKRTVSLLLALVMVLSLFPAATANELDNGLQYTVYADHVEITDYTGSATELEIPAEIEGLPVNRIGNSAFNYCYDLTGISIPDSVTSIGNYAFNCCYHLTSISIPDSVTSIGAGAFMECLRLTSVDLPDGITVIDSDTFSLCEELTSIDIPDSVTSIGSSAFSACYSLTSIDIPNSVTSIGDYAFEYCTGLTSIAFQGDVPQFGTEVFMGVTATAYYPTENTTWTEDVMQNYGGTITWVAHIHEYIPVITAPTCTDQGYTTYTCSCGGSYVADYVDALGHDYADGLCTRCGGFDPGLQYTVYADHVEITDYTGSATELEIPAEIEGMPVTSIGNSAFNYCYDLTSISIPDSVTSIGNDAFNCCYGLTSISIPNSVTSIGKGAFEECIRLTSVDLPDGITVIESDTFALCEKLTSIDIPDSVTSIGDCAFDYCKSLTSIDIPDGVTSIGSSAFSGCSSLTSIDIPDGVTSIGDRTFSYCSSLTSVDLPDSITSIGNEAFGYCPKLTSVTFQGDAPQFGTDVFKNVTATAYYPTDNATWTEDVMQNYGGTITWVALEPPHTHEYTAVVTAPTCTEQGFATYTCECGESYVDDYVDALGHDYADGLCTRCGFINGLQYEVCEDHVKITGYTGSATELVIPAEIEGKPVTSIGNSALLGCTSLTSIDLPDGVISVGNSAFYGCYNLTSIDLPDSISSIGDTAFTHCESLTSIDLPDSITSISRATFSACSSLTSISIPDSVTSIGNSAFSGCYDLASIDIPDSITSIGDSTFFNCSSLTSIDLPDGVTSIGSSAFSRCFKLTSIGLPDGVTSIGSYAFSHCNLTSFDLPYGVTSIGDYAFLYCVRLTSITFQGDAPQFGTTIFKDLTVTAYYPAGNATWTEDVMQNYGGNITWVSYASNPFTDVPAGSFYEKPVIWALENGITTGVSPTSFNPEGECLRAHVVTFLHRAKKSPAPTATSTSFTDVKSSDFFYNPVLWAVETGVTNGITATTFGANKVCNRAQVVTFLWRAAGCPEPQSSTNPFTDVEATDFFFKPVLWAVENGITNGFDTTHFGPAAPCNRAQVVTFLYRAYS